MAMNLSLGLMLGATMLSGGTPPVTATITGTPPDAVIGQPYSHTFTITFSDGADRPSALDSGAITDLAAHGIAYDGDTHTLSSDEVLA